ncbi:hypothetical protein [Pseudoalteromonas luteoviolacea]|uniref:Uncharacterized protein n=1 Tax=Pseudoalteromonas luteoviolacea NCIMB 1942 TaxID=1365253 RepID=A0A167C996_9GAMM|nr:hypothetical protein [Pseudoalteromonas luteoviolacea]KZN47392.1 hypothetical protein N482_09540 [Pseudoalteromonas luteoviolacea NCIMB 1942]
MGDPKGNPEIELGGIENVAGHTSILQLGKVKGVEGKASFNPLEITGAFSAEFGITGGGAKAAVNYLSHHYNGDKLPYKRAESDVVDILTPEYRSSLHHLAGAKYQGKIGGSVFVGVASPEMEGTVVVQAKAGVSGEGKIGCSTLILACISSDYFSGDLIQVTKDADQLSQDSQGIKNKAFKKEVGKFLNEQHELNKELYPLKVEEKWWCSEYKTDSVIAACRAHVKAPNSEQPLNAQANSVDTKTAAILNEIRRLGEGKSVKHENTKVYITLTELDGSIEGKIGAEAEVGLNAAVGEIKFKASGGAELNLASADYARKHTTGRVQIMLQPLREGQEDVRLMHTQDIDMTYTQYGVKALSAKGQVKGTVGIGSVEVDKSKSLEAAAYESTYSQVSYMALHTYWRTRPTAEYHSSGLSGNSLSVGSSVSLSYLDSIAKKLAGQGSHLTDDDVEKFVAQWAARLKVKAEDFRAFLSNVSACDGLLWISEGLKRISGKDTVFIESQYLLKTPLPFLFNTDNKLQKHNLKEIFVDTNITPKYIHLRANLNDSYTPKDWKLSLGVDFKVFKLGVELKSVDNFVAQQLSDLIVKTEILSSDAEVEWELPVATPMLQSYVS